MGGGWWSKGILEFRFGPNLGLRLEAGTKLNIYSMIMELLGFVYPNEIDRSQVEIFNKARNGEWDGSKLLSENTI